MKKAEIESAFVWGPWQKETRKTFAKAQPILEKLPAAVDPRYALYLLRERTWIAEKHSGPEQQKIERSWIAMCRAVEGFLNTISEQPSTELMHPELANALKRYSDKLSLPGYEEALEKKADHRPGVFWSDAAALALANHFNDKTSSPRWQLVAGLMQCAPVITVIDSTTLNEKPVSMEQRQTRQRIVRWQREKKLAVLFKPTLGQIAYEFKRKYTEWVRAGASGPCPSVIHVSSFSDPSFHGPIKTR